MTTMPAKSNPKRQTKGDVEVIKAFIEQRSASGKKLSTDGVRLDGHWMGGNKIAFWKGGKIHMPDIGSKTADQIQRSIRTFAAKVDLAMSELEENPAPSPDVRQAAIAARLANP